MIEVEGRPTVAEISLGALRDNCRQAGRLVGDRVGVMAVVKADAYGHGAVAAARAFAEAGAVSLGVSSVGEGIELRRAGITMPVVVLGGAFDGEEAAAVAHDLAVAVWAPERVRALAAAATAARRTAAVHVKVDTGMTRLGLDLPDVGAFVELLQTLAGLRVEGLFSHFASADAVETASARDQIARFREAIGMVVARGLQPRYVHLANSAAVLRAPEAHFTLVRPGIMLYGYAPAPHLADQATLRPAMRFETRIAQARTVPSGRAVGYGGTFACARASTIGVLPLGYADGYHRLASNRAQVLVRGRRVPVVGRVCMDHTMIDVTDVAGVGEGEPVVLFGAQHGATLGADELAGWWETIPYEVLTAVGRRVPRVYVEEFDA